MEPARIVSVGEQDDRPVLVAVGGASKSPLWLAALGVLLVVVAILKPWGSLGGPAATSVETSGPAAVPTAGTSARLGASASATASAAVRSMPSPSQSPAVTSNPAAIACLQPAGWRIVTLQRTDRAESRSWIVIQPAIGAGGPGDAVIAPFRLAEEDVVAIGFCGNDQHQGSPPALVVDAWRASVTTGEWDPIVIVGSRLGGLAGGGVATVYAPAAGPGASAAGRTPATEPAIPASTQWQAGRYAFKVTVIDSSATTYWFRVDLRWPPEPTSTGRP
jgi:hypothetical protein